MRSSRGSFAVLGITMTCAVLTVAPIEANPPQESPSQESKGEKKKEYPAQDPSLGAIAGRIVLKGDVPEDLLSKVDPVPSKDHANCGKSVRSDLTVLSEKKEIKHVVISIDGYKPAAKPEPRTITVDNKECLFTPRVQATTVGSTANLTNSDNFLHNCQGLLAANFNPAIPAGGVSKQRLPRAGWVLLRCSFHPWMTGHIHVFPHDLFDVTTADGAYRLVNVPPGEYDIHVWHERLAPVKGKVIQKKVKVEAGKTLELNLELESPKK